MDFSSFWNTKLQSRPRRSSPKVVSIPVHLVGPERTRSESESALKIQKVFRGFLVRKSVKKIAAIGGEVDEIERKMSRRETAEMIRKDEKERLRLNETLMNLLFRLDSVRGVDSGVRDRRKAVIRKVIALQERIDAIVSGDQEIDAIDETSQVESDENVESISQSAHRTTETIDSDDPSLTVEPKASNSAYCSNSSEIESDQALEKEEKATVTAEDTNSELPNPDELKEPLKTEETTAKNEEKVEESDMAENKETAAEAMEESVGTSSSDRESTNPIGEVKEGGEEEEEEETEITQPRNSENPSDHHHQRRRRSQDLQEKMMEDNEKMMVLMADLLERNYAQMQLLSSLTQRVEQLERALLCEKLRKKKKKKRAAAECSVRCPSAKKSGNI